MTNSTFFFVKLVPKRATKFRVFKTDKADELLRVYATDCVTADAVMEDLFAVNGTSQTWNFFRAKTTPTQQPIRVQVCARRRVDAALPQRFRVVKVNQAKKQQIRTFRLTVDSLLNLDGNHIRTESNKSGKEKKLTALACQFRFQESNMFVCPTGNCF